MARTDRNRRRARKTRLFREATRRARRPDLETVEDRTLLSVTVSDVSILEGNPGPITISGTLDPGNETDTVRILGRAGQRLLVDSTGASSSSATWTLYDPFSRHVNSQNITSDFKADLTLDGVYTLVIDGNADPATTITYSFQLSDISDAPVANTNFGTTYSGSIAAGQLATFNYNASAGTVILFDSLDQDGDPINFQLRDPANGLIWNQSASVDAGPIVLTRSGTYTLTVSGSGPTSTGDYKFRLLDLAANSTPITFGDTYTGDLPDASIQVFRVDLTPGQRILYDALDDDFDAVYTRLYGPGVYEMGLGTGFYSDSDSGPITASVGGTYYLYQTSQVTTGTANYSFRLLDVNRSPSQSLAVGETASGTLNPGESAQLYRVALTAGQRLYIDAGPSGDGSGSWYLYKPDDTSAISSSFESDAIVVAPVTGEYILAVFGSYANTAAEDYSIRLIDLDANSTALTYGTTYSGSLPALGAVAYRFNVTAGQRVAYDAIDVDHDATRAVLLNPSGQVEGLNQNASDDQGWPFLTQTGTYYLVLRSEAAATDYGFRLLDASTPALVPLATEQTGTLNPGQEMDLYRISGTAGQRLYIDFTSASGTSANWYLIRPESGSSVAAANIAADGFVTLPSTGDFLLAVIGSSATSIDYAFRVLDMSVAGTPLTFGTTYNGTLNGHSAVLYQFSGTAGQRLLYDAHDRDNDAVYAYLINPSGGFDTLNGHNADSDTNPFFLSQTGTYTLVLNSQVPTGNPDYQFRLLDTGAAPLLTLGEERTGTLTPGEATDLYRINGTAGQALFVDFRNVSSTSGSWYLYRPDNATWIQATSFGNDATAINLPVDGTYLLVLFGAQVADLSYTFQVVDLGAAGAPLAFGTEYAQDLPARASTYYTFNGTAGQRLFYDAIEDDTENVGFRLYDPDYELIQNLSYSDSAPFTLTKSGRYVVVMTNQTTATADFRFRLIDTAAAPAQALSFNTPVTTTLDPGRQTAVYRLNASAGQSLYVDFTAGTGGSWSLYSPTNGYLGGSSLGSDGEFDLSQTGEHLLVVLGNSMAANTYTLQANQFSDSATPLTLGDAVDGTISASGEQDAYTFNATTGQRLYFDGQAGPATGTINAILYAPDGTGYGVSTSVLNDAAPFTIVQTGTYRLVIDGNGATTGAYRFRLSDVTAAPSQPVTFGTPYDGTLTPGRATQLYTINGTLGHTLAITTTGTGGNWRLYGPGNEQLAAQGLPVDLNVVLPMSGTYVLAVQGNSDTPVAYSIQVDSTAPAAVTPANFNAVQSGNLAASGVTDFTFDAPAGLLVYFDSLDRDLDSANVQLRDPDNQIVHINQSASFDAGPYVLQKSGTYTLRLTNTSAVNPADYKFRFLNLATAATAYTLGADTEGTLPEYAAAVYTFAGTAGQRLLYDARDADSDNVQARLYRSDAESIFSINSDSDTNPFTLNTGATYYLIISNESVASTPDYRFALIDLQQGPSSALPLDGTAVSGTIDPGRAARTFRFDGTAGQLLLFDFTNTTTNATWRVYGPSNQAIANFGPSSDFMLRLPVSGQYVLKIDGTAAAAQPFNFRALQPSDGTALTFGTTYTATLAGESTRLFTFTGSVGQRLLYDSLENDFASVTAALYDPDGTLAHINTNSDNDVYPFTLTKAGTYTLAQRVSNAVDRSYSFRLLDAAQAPAQALTLGQTPITVTIDPGREIEVFRFNGTAGQAFYLDTLNNTGNVSWNLYRPNNATETSGNITTDQFNVLDATGEYLLVVTGASPSAVTLSFRLLDPATDSTALDLGTVYSGTLPDKSSAIYRFQGTAGQVLLYDGQDTDNDAVNATLYRASDGASVYSLNADQDSNPFRLTATGTYYLVLSSTATGTPDFRFRLIDTAAAPAVSLTLESPVSGTLNPGNAAQVYTFAGTAGQRLYLDFTSAPTSAASWYLYNPSLNYIYATSVGTDRSLELTQSGTHYLVFFGNYNVTAPTPYTFTLYNANTTTTPYTLGTTQAGTINEPGERDDYTFNGTAGQRLYFDGLGDSDPNSVVYVELYDPENLNVSLNTYLDADQGPFTLAKSGTYTLRVYSNTDSTASYAFRLLDLAQAPVTTLTEGTAYSGNLDPGQSTTLFRINATAGDRFYFDSLLSEFEGDGYWALYSPSNSYLAGTVLSGDSQNALTTTGTYILALQGYDTASTVPYNFRVHFSASPPTPLTLGATTLGNISKPGERDIYTFTGVPGQQLWFDGLSSQPGAIFAYLYEEDGTYVGLGSSVSGDSGPITLSHPGTYHLVIEPSGATTGDYSFRLLDLSAQPYQALSTTIAEVTVTLDAPSASPVSVDYSTADGTATVAGSDYTAASGTITFAPGETSKTIQVVITRDIIPESNETLFVNLSNPVGTTIADAQAQVTILNDDGPSIFVDNPLVVEGNSGTTTLIFTINLSTSSPVAASVNWATANGTATAGSDYVAASGTVTFAPGETIKTVSVTVNGDTLAEPHETLFLNLSNPVAAVILDGQGIGTIRNDDTAIVSSSPSVAEGQSGTTTMVFTVSLTQPVVQTVTVDFATADGTATAGTDYVAKTGTLTFEPGETTKTIEITVNGDTVLEPNESILLNFSNAVGGSILTPQAIGMIVNDDSELSISDAQLVEGNSGTRTMTFTVTLSPTSGSTVTVDYTTASGTATAGSDFVAKSGTLTFAPGESSKTIEITINGDEAAEAFELFSVVLSNPANATIGDSIGIGTIQNDDAAFVADDVQTIEGNSGTTSTLVPVRLVHPVVSDVSVQVATADGSATAPADYVALPPTTVTFVAGTMVQFVPVSIVGDGTPEPNEAFFVNLSNPSAGVIDDGQAIVTIRNDDTTVSIADVERPEGQDGTSLMSFVVSLSAPSAETVILTYTTAEGSATAGVDFVSTSGTITFNPGETSRTIDVVINGDTTPEWHETFLINLSGAVNAVLVDSQAIGTIQNDDAALVVDDVQINEGSTGTTTVTVPVRLLYPVISTVTVQAATADGTATAPADYAALAATLVTFAPGQTIQVVTVDVVGDTTPEADETFLVNLSNPTGGAVINDAQAVVTIHNDDTTIAVGPASVTEGNSGTTTLVFVVALSTPSSQVVTVDYHTVNGTAAAPDDYNTAVGSLTFSPGQTSQTVEVLVKGDTLDEFDETLFLQLTNATNATITTAQALGTILDDDAPVSVSIADASLSEGDAGTKVLNFTVSLSAVSGKPVTVNFSTADGTATAGADYNATSGTLTFNPGQTSQTIAVTILADTIDEPDETFLVNLSSINNATLADAQAVGTINDDDAGAGLSVADASVAEGNAGTTTLVFTVTLGAPSGQTVTVDYATANGTATSGVDYVATSGTLTFAPGETSKTINVTINGDTLDEFDETILIKLSNAANAAIGDGQAIGTILDDDELVAIAAGDATVTEGNAGTLTATFTVSLTAASGKPISVDYTTVDGTAVSPGDYASHSGTLTFAPGETTKTVSVTINGDTLDEFDETFLLNLSNATNAGLIDAQGVGTILDDDDPVTVTATGGIVAEGNSGNTTLIFQVSLSAPSGKPVTLNYATADGSATAGTDYNATAGTLTFAPGETTKTVSVTVLGDLLDEFDETVVLNLSGPSNAALGSNQAVGTILDDDATVAISVGDAIVVEGNSGTVTATFTVSLSSASGKTVAVDFSTADGTATAGTDYVARTGTLTFAPGETSKTVEVTVNGDTADESNETFFLNLINPLVNAVPGDVQGLGTILDDDDAIGNRPPVAKDDSATTTDQAPVTIAPLVNDIDPDLPGDTLKIVSVGSLPAGAGSLTFTDTTITYTPALNTHGDVDFSYTMQDAAGLQSTANVRVAVTDVTRPQVIDLRVVVGSQTFSIWNTSRTLPWINVQGLEVVFDEDVSVDQADLTLSGVNQGAYNVSSMNYDAASRTARWNLPSAVGVDQLLMVLDGDAGTGGVTDRAGNAILDGDFSRTIRVVPGDFDGDHSVSIFDATYVRNAMPPFGGIYSIWADLDADGDVDSDDINHARIRIGKKLP